MNSLRPSLGGAGGKRVLTDRAGPNVVGRRGARKGRLRRAEKKRVAPIAVHPEVKPAEAKAVEPAAPEPLAERIEASVEAPLTEAVFELRLDGSSFKAGKRR